MRLDLARLVDQHHPVTPLLLGLVHRQVGGDERRLAAVLGLAAEHRHADADRDRRRSGRRALEPDFAAQVLGETDRSLTIGLGKQHRELVSRQPRNRVRDSGPRPQQLGDVANHVVPGLMAGGVVDVLEVIDVEDQHRALPP